MRPADQNLYQQIAIGLLSFDKNIHPLPGIRSPNAYNTFIEQILDSIHRIKYLYTIANRRIRDDYADPRNDIFDPIKAAILNYRSGNIDEAFWLVFLLTHFGKHRQARWLYTREIYGSLGADNIWNWVNTSADPARFKKWINNNKILLIQLPHGFGNHRKYESLASVSSRGTGAVVESYIHWVGPTHSHQNLLSEAYKQSNNEPEKTFDYLYQSMKSVKRFGRLARFDYLTMIGNIGLAMIKPGYAYLKNSTGPIIGARLLFDGNRISTIETAILESLIIQLDKELKVGMQVLEDALCNWQKSPDVFQRFRG